MAARRHVAFKHYDPTSERIAVFQSQLLSDPTNLLERLDRGESLQWVCRKTTIGGKAEPRFFPWWHGTDGQPLGLPTKGLPTLVIRTPPAPVKGMYVTMTDVLRYPEGALTQRVVLDNETSDPRFADWMRCYTYLNKVLNEDRCAAMVNLLEEHDMFSDADRKKAAKAPAKFKERLIDALQDPNNRSQHQTRPNVGKNKIIKERYDDGADALKVSLADEQILAVPNFDTTGLIRARLESADRPSSLNLLKITLPIGTNDADFQLYGAPQVEPYVTASNAVQSNELSLLNSGGVASMELTIYGVHYRSDGQVSVMTKTTGVSLMTNGPSSGSEFRTPSMMDMYASEQTSTAKRAASPYDESETKKLRQEETILESE